MHGVRRGLDAQVISQIGFGGSDLQPAMLNARGIVTQYRKLLRVHTKLIYRYALFFAETYSTSPTTPIGVQT